MSDSTKSLVLAAGLGAVVGMRSMSGPALLSHYLMHHPWWRRPRGLAGVLASGTVAGVLEVLAAGEMVADKTPVVPDRTELPALLGRAVIGAFCSAVVADRRGGSRVGAMLVGAGAAVGATFLAYHLRKEAGNRFHVPDPLLGLVEDGLVLAAGSRLAKAA